MTNKFPFYLQTKLATIDITIEQINEFNYLQIFAQLKAEYKSLAYQALFDLYMFATQNTYPSEQIKNNLIQEYLRLPPLHELLNLETISYYLELALEQAKIAANNNEIPIGAVIVHQDKIIGSGYNQTKQDNSIFAHAEMIAIAQAQKSLNNYRLDNCDLYVTIEPCLMCSGAIIHSRIRRVIYGATEPKTGACCSQYQVFNNRQVNSHCQIIGSIDQAKYSKLIQEFFKNKK